MKDGKLDSAAVVSLFYESIFAPKSWIGLSEQAIAVSDATSQPNSAKTFGKNELEPVLPYLEQALVHETTRSKIRDQEKSRALKLHDLPLPVVIVASDLEVISMTAAAESFLDSDPLFEWQGRFLTSTDRTFQKQLGSTVAEAIDSKESMVLAHNGDSESPGMILMAPMPLDRVKDSEPYVALFFNFEFEDTQEISPILMKAHGLTLSESDVVAHLIRGHSLEEISTLKKTSIHTVRTQIKNIYSKTGTRRQGELVSHVLSGPAMWLRLLKVGTGRRDSTDSSYAVSHHQMTLRDGRLLSYGDFGPRTGTPVILIHQLYGVRTEPEKDEALLDELNIRLVVPERPGVGYSSPHKGQCLEDWSKDTAELADKLELDRFSVIGISGGGPYAMACGVHLGDRVARLGLVASDVPVDELPDDARVVLPRKFLTSMARHWPKGARALLEIAYRRMYDDPDDAIRDFSERGSEADRALLRNPEIYRICLRNLKEAGEIPKSVLAEELIMLSRPWGFCASDIRVPTFLWHGRQDHYCSGEHAEALSRLIPDCTPIIRDDWGHYFYYAHWKALLAQIVS